MTTKTLVLKVKDPEGHLSPAVNVVFNFQSAAAPLIGTTLRGTDSSDSVVLTRPNWNIIRTYIPGDYTKAKNKPWGPRVAASFKTTVSATTGWRNNSSLVTAMTSALQALPDRAGDWVCDWHEPEDNYGRTAAGASNYAADATKFSQIVASVNAGRTNPLKIFRCLMGYSLDLPGSAGVDPASWMGTGYDAVGIDTYSYKAIQLGIDFAARMGKPLVVPEMGPLSNVPHQDTAGTPQSNPDYPKCILDFSQTGLPAFTDAGALWVCWFDKKGSGADFDAVSGDHSAYTQSLAYWGSKVV